MKLYKAIIIGILLSFNFITGCSDGGVIDCAKKWILYNYQNVSIGFNNGGMAVFSSSLTNGTPSTFLYKDTISGDFEMILEYEDLFFNSPGLGFQISLTGNALNQGNSNYFSAQIGTTLYPGLPQGVLHVGAFIDSLGNAPGTSNGNVQAATNTYGELRFRRFGATVEVISKTGTGNVAAYTKTFYNSPVVFGILYGSNYPNTPNYSSSVRITNFRYYQNSTVIDSDAFDCNSVQ